MAKTGINLKITSLAALVLFVLISAIVLKTRQSTLRVNSGSDISSQYAQDGGVIYLNTAKDVKYIGSEKCQTCHPAIFESYAKAEMGRSMAKLDTTNIIEKYPQSKAVYDSVMNYYYEMVERNGRFYQREYRLDSLGHVIHERLAEAEYVMGSGNNLRMYFDVENGMFYQLPLTWYVHKQAWDLSPGYREFGNLRFSRFATAKCLSCHSSYLQVSLTANERYVKPFPLGIGCERCHGPGELHVKQMRGDKIENLPQNAATIVNPRKLSPQRQLDVCRQCHLQGKAWALRGQNDWFDYRPGKLLESHRSVYFPEKTRKDVFEVADAAQRMELSRCFTNSNGTMTCITCHDPHYSIKTFTIEHYTNKCLTCHLSEKLPGNNARHSHRKTDNCISCHMNSTGTDNTLHGVTTTDHWIRIDEEKTFIDWSTLRQPSELRPLISLVPDVDAKDMSTELRKGVAYFDYYKEHERREAYLDSALTNLTKSLKRTKNKAAAYFYLGEIHFELEQYSQALQMFKQAIVHQPNDSDAYFKLGKTFSATGNFEMAIKNFRRATQLKPEEPAYLENLGMALAKVDKYEEASAILERSLRIDKKNPYTYYTLGNIYARQYRSPEKALVFYKELVVLDPDFPNGYLNLGNTYALLGKYEEAIRSYENEIFVRPNSFQTFINVGHVYKQMARITSARNAFEKALEIDPSSEVAKELLRQL